MSGIDTARGPLHLVESFAGTLGAEDLLATREHAIIWLRTAGLLAADAGLSNSEHSALLRLRDSIRDLLAARADGREDADAATRLTRALAEGRLVVTVGPDGAVKLATAARASYPSVVAAIAVAIAESAADPTWPA